MRVKSGSLAEEYATASEAARELRVTRGRVVEMARDGLLRTEKFGRDLAIRRADLAGIVAMLRDRRRKAGSRRGTAGRPVKPLRLFPATGQSPGQFALCEYREGTLIRDGRGTLWFPGQTAAEALRALYLERYEDNAERADFQLNAARAEVDPEGWADLIGYAW